VRASLAQRLFGSFLLVLAVGFALLGWQARRIEGRLLEVRERAWTLRELELSREGLPRAALARRDARVLDAWCDRIGRATDERFTLIGPDGVLLGDTDLPLDSLTLVENHAHRPEVLQALAHGEGWSRRRSKTVGRDLWYEAIPLGEGHGPRPVLRVAVPLERLAAEERAELQLILLALVVAFLTAAVLALGAGWVLSGRLRRTVAAARRMGRGELAARAPEQPEDEVGRLGRSLNRMAENLERRVRELAEGRDQRERILSHLVDGVALLDPARRVVHANQGLAAVLGLDRPPAVGARFLEEVRQPALTEILDRAAGREAALTEELTFYSPALRTVEATVVNLGGAAGGSAQLLVLHDLSRIKQLERVRQEFVANVSHELKTPLTLLRGAAETLLDGGLEDEAHRRRFVEAIQRHAERLQRIVDDLLELARLEQPGIQPGEGDVDLAALARGVAESFREAAAARGLALEVEVGTAPIPVRGDAAMLERALANLVDNAVKYTQAGSVRVAAGGSGETAWCEVRDTGPGIPPEHLPRIFERFYRVDQGRSRELGGTGLGLSIVRHVAELHGGRVSVESELGRGSTFRVELPMGGGA